jgi:hypothetical protein
MTSIDTATFISHFKHYLSTYIDQNEPEARKSVLEVDLTMNTGTTVSGEVYQAVTPTIFKLVGYVITLPKPPKADPSEQNAL